MEIQIEEGDKGMKIWKKEENNETKE